MAAFYFDIYANGRQTRYNVAAGCASLGDAKRKALNLLSGFASEDADAQTGQHAYAVHLTDGKGNLVCAVMLKVANIEAS